METFVSVRPEHLNHYGYLFGGMMLKWVDEFAGLAALRDFPGRILVTVGMDHVQFKHPVANGSILRFHIRQKKQGVTSVSYSVEVHATAPGSTTESWVFATSVTFVRVDESGGKCPIES